MNVLLKSTWRFVLLLTPLAWFSGAVGCGSPRSSSSSSSAPDSPAGSALVASADKGANGSFDGPRIGDGGDVLRVGDPISIRFSGVTVSEPPASVDERLKSDGMLRLPLIREPIKAEGKTRGQLEEEIYKLYVPKFFRTLTVKVGSEGRVVHVRGEVKNPGRIQYMGEMTVLKAITAASGFTDFAKRGRVQVTRANGRKITVNCNKAQADSKYDLPVYPDDQIEAERRLF